MCQTSLSLWFVCRLCRGSFGQVDAFIEHKKQKHFTQFQNTTSIVFQESEQGEQCPIIIEAENQPADESTEPRIKIKVEDEDPIIPLNSEIMDEPSLDMVEVKSELITYESEINPDNENNFFGLEQPEQNPYVLLKRLTAEEIQRACVPQLHSSLLPFKRKSFESNLERRTLSADIHSTIGDIVKIKECAETQLSLSDRNISLSDDLQFECKLCSKQLQSEALLRIHVGICALYHEDRNRFCVTCNRKYYDIYKLKDHRVKLHGTEGEKMSLYKFKCHLCLKKYQNATDFRFHQESHQKNKEQVKPSKSNYMKCSRPNCEKEFKSHQSLRVHIAAFHLGVKPFSCHYPNCNKTFSQRYDLERHLRTHTGQRPYKCTVDNCNKAFKTSSQKSRHYRTVHLH